MIEYQNYVNGAFGDLPESEEMRKFKNNFIDEITRRANELTHAGIRDEKVVSDLIIDEHPDIKAEFSAYLSEKKQKKLKKQAFIMRISGSVLYSLVILLAFFLHLFTVDNGLSWIILAGGFAGLIIYFCLFTAKKLCSKSAAYHPVSRVLTAFSVMLLGTVVFFVMLFKFNIVHSWLIFAVALIAAMAADIFYSYSKHLRFALLFTLLYIPVISALLFIIFCVTGALAWKTGWLIILAGIAVDFAVIFVRLTENIKESNEVEADKEWNAD